MAALLSMKMGAGETLRSYISRYWELYNKINGGNEKICGEYFSDGVAWGFRTTGIVDEEASWGYEVVDEAYQGV